MDPRTKVCSQVKLGGGEMRGRKRFLENSCSFQMTLEKKKDTRSRIEKAQLD